MASSDNMASFETWVTSTTFDNSWYTDAFARDNEALTKALTQSLTNGADVGNVSFSQETPALLPVHSVSTSGGSEPERETLSVSKRVGVRNGVSGKIAKRKSRASKRSQTTFITADPANFRQMVQQVTGVGFGLGTGLIKPEPQRAGLGNGIGNGNGNGNGGYMLPTLDTSAFLLDHHQQVVGPTSVSGGTQVQAGGTGFDFDGFSCFPTLESWKVM